MKYLITLLLIFHTSLAFSQNNCKTEMEVMPVALASAESKKVYTISTDENVDKLRTYLYSVHDINRSVLYRHNKSFLVEYKYYIAIFSFDVNSCFFFMLPISKKDAKILLDILATDSKKA